MNEKNKGALSLFHCVLILAATTLFFAVGMFLNPDGIQSEDDFRNLDWLSTRLFDAFLHKSVNEFGQFPFWCPYFGGGYPVYQHPSSGSLTPLAPAVIVFGEIYGVKINLLCLLFLGGLGVFLLARNILKISNLAALFSALSYLVSGWFPSMMLVGFYNLAIYHLIPLILYFFVRSFSDRRHLIPAASLFAFFAWLATWGTVILAIFCVLLSIGYSFSRRDRSWRFTARPLTSLVLLGALTLIFVGPRLYEIHKLKSEGTYPHASVFLEKPYNTQDTWERFYQGPRHFLEGALGHVSRKARYDQNHLPLTSEYAFLGIPWSAFALFFFSVLVLRRRYLPWLAAGFIFTWLCFGPNSPVDLYKLTIWQAPFLRGIGDFFKYANYFILLTIVLPAGAALPHLLSRLKTKAAQGIAIGLIFSSLAPFAILHFLLFADLFKLDLPQRPYSKDFYQVKWQLRPRHPELEGLDYRELMRPAQFNSYYNLKRNIGTIDWYADIYLPENAIPKFVGDEHGQYARNPDYQGEAFFIGPGNNRVKELIIKANTIHAKVQLTEPARLVINQNHHPDWRAWPGEAESHRGLLSVVLEKPGSYEVVFRFQPRRFQVCLIFMAFSVLLSWLFWFWLNWKHAGKEKE